MFVICKKGNKYPRFSEKKTIDGSACRLVLFNEFFQKLQNRGSLLVLGINRFEPEFVRFVVFGRRRAFCSRTIVLAPKRRG
jgi:hypothetical protein